MKYKIEYLINNIDPESSNIPNKIYKHIEKQMCYSISNDLIKNINIIIRRRIKK